MIESESLKDCSIEGLVHTQFIRGPLGGEYVRKNKVGKPMRNFYVDTKGLLKGTPLNVRTEFKTLFLANAFCKKLRESDYVTVAEIAKVVAPDILVQGMTSEKTAILVEHNKDIMLDKLAKELDKTKIWDIINHYLHTGHIKIRERTELPDTMLDYREELLDDKS
jgi:hypothetical protein